MQPKLLPIEKKYSDYREKRNREGKLAAEKMLKQPYTFQQAVENLQRLKAERLIIK